MGIIYARVYRTAIGLDLNRPLTWLTKLHRFLNFLSRFQTFRLSLKLLKTSYDKKAKRIKILNNITKFVTIILPKFQHGYPMAASL